MIAVRIFKYLQSPIVDLPELDGLVGRHVELVAMEAAEPEIPVSALAPLDTRGTAPPIESQTLRRRVRVCGTVTDVNDSGGIFYLKIDPAAEISCTWAADGASAAIGAGGQKMVVAGTGIFAAAGVLVRIDVKAALLALPTDARFARVPRFADEEPVELGTGTLISEQTPGQPVVALTSPPIEPPRPALSAATSFTAIFGKQVDD